MANNPPSIKTNMKIALAQVKSLTGNIEANIRVHQEWVKKAVRAEAELIVFPELSLTGYEPRLARELAIEVGDDRLEVFQNLSDRHRIVIAVGAPVDSNSGIQIGMLIFQPGRPRVHYAKQMLHKDELAFFTSGNRQVLIEVGSHQIAPAICYESTFMSHAEEAVKLGAEVYLASVAKSQDGVMRAVNHYAAVARELRIPVLMVNNIGFNDNFTSAGQSAVWNTKGVLIDQLPADQESLLVYTLSEGVRE